MAAENITRASLEELPDGVLRSIFALLCPRDRTCLGAVNSALRRVESQCWVDLSLSVGLRFATVQQGSRRRFELLREPGDGSDGPFLNLQYACSVLRQAKFAQLRRLRLRVLVEMDPHARLDEEESESLAAAARLWEVARAVPGSVRALELRVSQTVRQSPALLRGRATPAERLPPHVEGALFWSLRLPSSLPGLLVLEVPGEPRPACLPRLGGPGSGVERLAASVCAASGPAPARGWGAPPTSPPSGPPSPSSAPSPPPPLLVEAVDFAAPGAPEALAACLGGACPDLRLASCSALPLAAPALGGVRSLSLRLADGPSQACPGPPRACKLLDEPLFGALGEGAHAATLESLEVTGPDLAIRCGAGAALRALARLPRLRELQVDGLDSWGEGAAFVAGLSGACPALVGLELSRLCGEPEGLLPVALDALLCELERRQLAELQLHAEPGAPAF
eukprot:tig00021275_g19868.t1